MNTYSTWERPMAPISPTVRAVAHMFLDANLPDEMPAPVGLLVGEQPGPKHNAKLPLWPWPKGSAGARLHQMSGLGVAEYLTKLARVNLALRPTTKWDEAGAKSRAVHLLSTVPDGTRIVLCGARARDAFDLDGWFRPTRYTLWDVSAVAIPHPSGRCREYNEEHARRQAGQCLRWAAGEGVLP